MADKIKPTQKLATHTLTDLYYRDQNLVTDMMGKMSFTEAMIGHILNRTPTAADVAIIDAVLLALMEHGLTPAQAPARVRPSPAQTGRSPHAQAVRNRPGERRQRRLHPCHRGP